MLIKYEIRELADIAKIPHDRLDNFFVNFKELILKSNGSLEPFLWVDDDKDKVYDKDPAIRVIRVEPDDD